MRFGVPLAIVVAGLLLLLLARGGEEEPAVPMPTVGLRSTAPVLPEPGTGQSAARAPVAAGSGEEVRTRRPPAGSVLVRVLDPEGMPVAGFPLRLWTAGPFPEQGDEEQEVSIPPTDGQGETRFVLEERPRGLVEVVPAAPLVRTPGVALPAEPDPTVPLLLRVPRTAAVVVRLRLADGTRWSHAGRVWLGPYPRTAVQRIEGDEVRFPHVGLHEPLELRIDELGEYETIEKRFPGLGQDEVERVHEIVLVDRYPVLTARLVLEDGRAFADGTGVGRLASGEDQVTLPVQTDAEGRTRLPIVLPFHPGATRILEVQTPVPAGRWRELQASVDLSFPLPNVDHDVGDLVLSLRTVLVSGWLEDPGGERLPFRGLQLLRRRQSGGELEPVQSFLTGGDGSFFLAGDAPEGELFLDLPVPERWRGVVLALPRPQPFEAGARDVAVRLVEAARIRGRVEAVEDLDHVPLVLRLEYPDGSHEQVPVVRSRFDRSLRPGTVDLRVELHGGGAALATLTGVVLAPAEETADPRLDPLRLAPALRVVRVTVQGAEKDVRPRVLTRESAAGPYLHEAPTYSRDVRWIATASDRLDVLVTAPACRTREFHAVVGDFECVLEPGLEVAVRTNVDAAALPAGVTLVAAALQTTSEAFEEERELALPDEVDARVLRGRARRPGEHRLALLLEHAPSGRRAEVPVTTVLRVEETDEVQTFQVEVDPLRLRASLSQLVD